ncbi:MAG: ribosome maturation factor RimM [Gammaproteobacteria bacterium]|nr:ribosome maturation factor RimM [Gammaproteobacteria bacterium]
MRASGPEHRPTPLIVVGRVGAVHGIRGAVIVHSYTSPPEQIFNYPSWQTQLGQRWQPLKICSQQAHGTAFIVRFDGYTDRDQAKLLTHAEIWVERSCLPSLPPDEFYWHDLIGLNVITLEGVQLGTVTSLLETGSNDVLIVEQDKKQHLIPYLRDTFIKEIDLNKKHILVDWDPEF